MRTNNNGTPKGTKANYAVAVNFSIKLDCYNHKNLYPDDLETREYFKDLALKKLHNLIMDSFESQKRGEHLPISFEVYDASLESPDSDSISDPDIRKS